MVQQRRRRHGVNLPSIKVVTEWLAVMKARPFCCVCSVNRVTVATSTLLSHLGACSPSHPQTQVWGNAWQADMSGSDMVLARPWGLAGPADWQRKQRLARNAR